jgi:lycopene cyclase domain-containing protein
MSYSVLAVVAVLLAAAVDLAVLRTRLLGRKAFWTAYAIILAFQLIVNGILTGVPVVRYNADAIWGARIAYAPVEDLLFGFALVLWTLTLWVGWGRRCAGRATR